MLIYARDSLRKNIESKTDGKVTVVYDDKGYPSYMHVIPKFNNEDINPDWEAGTFPAFIVNGVEKSEILVGQYIASTIGEGADKRAVSMPGVEPAHSISFDDAKALCVAKNGSAGAAGPWHLQTNWEWAALVHSGFTRDGFQPNGNTYYGRYHAQVNGEYETGRRADGLEPGTNSGLSRTLTGSGPVSWRHDNTLAGVADMTGNVWKWMDGLHLRDGVFYMPNTNDFRSEESTWVNQGVIIADDGGIIKLGASTDTLHPAAEITIIGAWSGLKTTAGFEGLSLATKQLMQQALINPLSSAPVGTFYFNNVGERVPIRGGYWGSTSNAGPGALALTYVRSHVFTYFGFPLAYIS